MAVTLGKRKRRANLADDRGEPIGSDDENVRALFQRAFEAKFKPLERKEKFEKTLEAEETVPSEKDDYDEASDWSGLSEDDAAVEVVEHDVARRTDDESNRQEVKAFMSSKPPSSPSRKARMTKKPEETEEDDEAESTNLKHDLALQRLLKESHLLDSATFTGSTAAPEGKNRLKALDIRLQDLGAKKSLSEQEQMPLAHRKGIKAKAASREATRRKEAAENGIILERAKLATKSEKRRDKGIGAPSVGKFKGGTLKLSSRDVQSIEGPKRKPGKGRRR